MIMQTVAEGKDARRLLKRLYLEWLERIEDGHGVQVRVERDVVDVVGLGQNGQLVRGHRRTGEDSFTIQF